MSSLASPSYALLGSGRLARHLQFYLHSLNLPVWLWSRDGDLRYNSSRLLDASERLAEVTTRCTHLLFAIGDSSIAKLSEHFLNSAKTLVHFSGALELPGVCAAHPLMTFGPELGEVSWYRSIPFVLDQGKTLRELLPGLENPSWQIPSGQRAFYHALCSLAGNSTFLLWRKIGDEFENRLNLPRALLAPFLHQVVVNSSSNTPQGFTGPVARGDWPTVQRHLEALESHPDLKGAYRAYLNFAGRVGHPVPEVLQ